MPLLDLFWTMLMLFLWIAWFWLLVSVIADIFRSHDLSGWGKAAWVAFTILIPWLGVLAYVLARGDGMAGRSSQRAQDAMDARRDYVREAAGTPSASDEIARLAELRDAGTLTDEEFQAQKARTLAG